MQTQTEEQFPQKGLVTEWFPEKGFGFVAIGGKRIFVHVSDINPWHDRGVNLKGKTLVVHSTEDSPKGRRVSCADTLEEYEKRETERAEEARKKELAQKESLEKKAEQRLKDELFMEKYPSLLEKWVSTLQEKMDHYLGRFYPYPGWPTDFLPEWYDQAPWAAREEVRAIVVPYEKRTRTWALECLDTAWAKVKTITQAISLEMGIDQESFDQWFEVTKDRGSSYSPCVMVSEESIREAFLHEISILKSEVEWKRAEPIREKIMLLAKSCRETHGEWSRADLSGVTMERLSLDRPKIIVAYLGESKSEILSGVYGNSGEAWTCDTGHNVHSGSWYIRPDLVSLIRQGKAVEALYKVRREISALVSPKRRQNKKADYRWVKWNLERTSIEGSPPEYTNSAPECADYERAHQLVTRILIRHPRIHVALREKYLRDESVKERPAHQLLTKSDEAEKQVEHLQARQDVEEEALQKQEEKSEQFLSQGAWSALDKFEFKK